MSKEKSPKKSDKKKALLTAKEKKAAKRLKKEGKPTGLLPVEKKSK
ncbi:MAG: hypothetical protein P1U57_07835 [Oleibacter sp.]|nr:hypothetical protein [Thalassolituus sp.]